MSQVLIAEDNTGIAAFVAKGLRSAGYAPVVVGTAHEAWEHARTGEFDLLILDIGLPDADGFSVLRRLREARNSMPVIVLTARSSVTDTVAALEGGADDYMAKPFSLSELEARVRALGRRGAGTTTPVLRHGRLTFDPTGRVVTIDDERVDLSAREISLLEVLLSRNGQMVSKNQLIDHLSQRGEEISANAVEVYIHRLRKKLEPGGVRILTVRGLGYCLDPSTGGAGRHR